jgi:Kef-type K+ transport system membrane component KefB
VHDAPASAKLQFLGKSLFIPIFFVATGFPVNPVTFVYGTLENFLLVTSIIGALLIGKEIAASAADLTFGYNLNADLRSGRSRYRGLPPLPQHGLRRRSG